MTPNRAVPAVNMQLLRAFERGPHGVAFAPRAYQDSGGVWTIGRGHVITPEDPLFRATINEATADALAESDLDDTAAELETLLGRTVVKALTESQWAALIDFTFNEGAGKIADSTLIALVRSYRFAEVPAQFRRWIFGRVQHAEVPLPGLEKRREAEAHIWLEQPWA